MRNRALWESCFSGSRGSADRADHVEAAEGDDGAVRCSLGNRRPDALRHVCTGSDGLTVARQGIGQLFGGQGAVLSRIIYTLVGIAAVWCISLLFRDNDLIEK